MSCQQDDSSRAQEMGKTSFLVLMASLMLLHRFIALPHPHPSVQ